MPAFPVPDARRSALFYDESGIKIRIPSKVIPKKHHYIPIFYLSRWSGADGCICQFSRPYGHIVKPRRVHPAATGYVNRLYELQGFEPELAQQVEQRFFQSVDNLAAEALALLEVEGAEVKWDSRRRSAWSRFLLSLLLRCPEDLEIFRIGWAASLQTTDGVSEKAYREARSASDPETLSEFMKNIPKTTFEKSMFDLLMKLLDNQNIGQTINDMYWHVIDMPTNAHVLLTSDRPTLLPHPLKHRNAHIAIPIGPRKLFVAASRLETIHQIRQQNLEKMAVQLNTSVVECAVKYVYSENDRCLRFVQNRMSKANPPRILQRLFA